MNRRRAILLASALALAPACTDTYLGRYLAWNLSDVDDAERFPARPVRRGPRAFDLPRVRDDARIEALFEGLPYRLAGFTFHLGSLPRLLVRSETTAFVVLHRGAVVYERYGAGKNRESHHASFSVAKSVTALLVGAALDEGLLASVRDPATKYVPELPAEDFGGVTLEDLLRMASGLGFGESKLLGVADFPWQEAPRVYYGLDLRGVALAARREEAPGAAFHYNNLNTALLGVVLERATGRTIAAYTEEKLWTPIGAEADAFWNLDSEERGFEKVDSNFNARARDYARIGLLLLRGGELGGARVLSQAFVRDATAPYRAGDAAYYARGASWSPFRDHRGYYAYQWWGHADPDGGGDFFATGHLGQLIYVSPKADLVVIRNGRGTGPLDTWSDLARGFALRVQGRDPEEDAAS